MAAASPAQPSGAERARGVRQAKLLSLLALGAIVILAFGLRWQHLEFTEYTRDQAWVLNRAYDWLVKGDFPLVGIQSSVGTAQGAIEIYLLAIPVALSKDPRLAAAFVGLLQVLAIVGTYLLCSAYFGRKVGLVAALLYAVNPWALQYARKVWTPNMAPLFTVLFFSSVFAAVVQRRRYWLGLACLWAVVLFLIHPSAVYCAGVLGIVVLLFWRRLGPRPLLLGGALGLMVAAPYLWYEYLEGFRSLRLLFGLTGGQSRLDLDAVKNIVTMASAYAYPTMMGYGFTGDWVLPDQTVQNWLANALLYLGIAWCLWELVAPLARRPRAAGQWEKHLLLLLWLVLPILVALRHPLDFYPHYFINVLPIQYILMAVGLTRTAGLAGDLLHRPGLSRAGLVAATALALYIAGSQVIYFQRYLGYIQEQEPLGHYGVPYLYTERMVDTARQLRQELGVSSFYMYSSAQWDAIRYLGRPDIEIREVDTREGLALPRDANQGAIFVTTDDSIVVTDVKPFVPRGDGLTVERLRGLGYVELPERAVRGPLGYVYYRFYYLAPQAGQGTRQALDAGPQLALANGMRLLGTLPPRSFTPGQKADLAVLWDVPEGTGQNPSPECNLVLSLLDQSGRTVKEFDWPVAQYQDRHGRDYLPPWRAEDLPVAYYDLKVPADLAPGTYRLALSAYQRDNHAAVGWLDASGRDAGESLSLGSVSVH
ncbi:MAG: glycosyltransferase family 39 protein [Chloroflexi bacterium]|nr:glycosyltransferase family 39 protein [Chloroflexota bacterium]